METLTTTDSRSEALEIAEALNQKAIDENTTLGSLVKVLEVDLYDPITDTTLGQQYQVIATDRTPRRGRIIWEAA